MLDEMKQQVAAADFVLVGLGDEVSESRVDTAAIMAFYRKLSEMLKGREYFIVTLNTDDLIYESPLDPERIVAPCGSERAGNVVTDEKYDESGYLPQWQKYTKWLEGTLNKKLCILELGVGFQYPTVIRFPFEKIVFFNQKSVFFRIHSTLSQLTPEIKERSTAAAISPVKLLLEEQFDE